MLLPTLSCALFVVGCTATSTEKSNPNDLKLVPVTQLNQIDTVIYKEYIADIQSQRNVELRSRLSGFLNRIYVDEGSFVKKDQVLFTLIDDEYKADYARAEALLNSSLAEVSKVELEMERTKKLVEKNVVGSTEYDLLNVQLSFAKAKVKEAEAILKQEKTKLSATQIRAPFDGRIDRVLLKEGSLLEQGSLLTTISDITTVNVYFDISENEYLKIATDSSFNRNSFKREVKLILANGDLYPYTGEAEIVENEFNTSTGSISLRAKFPNPDGLLKHGATGRIGVPIQTGNLLMVHQKSVIEIQDKAYVYKLNGDTVNMTPFKIGQRVGHYYVVEDGLSKDSKIVFEGGQGLRDGMLVEQKLINN